MLELSNIDAGYGAFQALFGVSMSVNAGEAVAVIGANGAGKTTLLRVISGLLPATAGTMTMEGVPLTEIAPPETGWTPERQRRSVVFPAPFAPTTVTISPEFTWRSMPCSTSIRP